ncbi:hypothetical protein [Streptomyces sp. NBC_00162]|uniref:hypothetical protein n=1 Tax=Streptomyces sp. NBC_00162 TaxID=2903629 RepID=UPI00214AB7C8|nr:hypothetical protein [Streptomyces sp. NBC_00162]UUU37462.1 hypothetical protein JIW86_00040 [Streptomyces sp. NBC_00162]
MAQIANDRIVERANKRSDGSWEFLITYTVNFDAFEIGRFFHDSVKVWEEDSSDDDQVTAYAPVETFSASGPSVFRRKQFTAQGDALNTELGDEEIYAWIWIRDSNSTGPAADEQRTPIKSINP